jgi:hypothetical protein
MKRFLPLALLILALCLSCFTTIRDIKENPRKYNDTIVTVPARITEKIEVPLIPVRLYRILDDTDVIFLVSTSDYNLNDFTYISGKVIALDGEEGAAGVDAFSDQFIAWLEEKELVNDSQGTVVKSVISFVSSVAAKVEVGLFLFEG